MTYTIQQARYCNPDNTAVEIFTVESAWVLVPKDEQPDLWNEVMEWGTPDPYVAPDSYFRLFKTTIIERMTDPELETFEEGMAAAPLRHRVMWRDCQAVMSTDPLFDVLKSAVAQAFGETRANEILAPE